MSLTAAAQSTVPMPPPQSQSRSQQIALDAAFNIMKEFWPDVRHKLFHQ
jgi:hypothetical protein